MTRSNKNRLFKNPANTDIRFFSLVTSSVTHELNNVLSIINQTGGLLEDQLYGASQGKEILPEKLERIAELIEQQTLRGIDIIKRLNYFSHTCDSPEALFDVRELIDVIVNLSQRYADLSKMKLHLSFKNSDALTTYNNPLKTQQIIFLTLKEIFLAGAESEEVEISVAGSDKRVIILINHVVSSCIYKPDTAVIKRIAGEIGGLIEIMESDNNLTYKITVPDHQ